NEFFFTHFLHSLFSGKDRDLKIQRQRVLYRGLTNYSSNVILIKINPGSLYYKFPGFTIIKSFTIYLSISFKIEIEFI
ncbi:hypothetical protein KQP69_14480, partial [Bacteroides thetaiotaomicron]